MQVYKAPKTALLNVYMYIYPMIESIVFVKISRCLVKRWIGSGLLKCSDYPHKQCFLTILYSFLLLQFFLLEDRCVFKESCYNLERET